MRRRKHEEEKKFFSKGTMISLFIVLIMVLSIAGFIATQNNQSSNDIVYGDYTFTRVQNNGQNNGQNTWRTEWEGKQLTFFYDPYIAENIELAPGTLDDLKATKMFYFTYNNDSNYLADMALVQYDYQRLLQENLGIFVERGMAFQNDYSINVSTCATATKAVPVLLFRGGNETTITREGDCVIATVQSQSDVYLLGDRILYSLYGIIT